MLKKISKILIANRGEIACRIIRTAHKIGISCVAVYSDADARSLYVSKADESFHIGQSIASQSYLDIKKICAIATKSGCDAVHPGYGFLSENHEFARMLAKKNICFIGPDAKTIQMMGDKVRSKQIAKEAGVNTVPGYAGIISSIKEAEEIAESTGFPVMLKATAGGGGKGMRIIYSKPDIAQAFESASNEALKNFKDNRIFIEKYIENPRHIEVQILADQYGNVVCLGERECSIQRHNQKVIEETPSPFLDEETRQKMYTQCVSLAQKVGYISAGTVEFIVDKNKNFYFLEMNTRLQVEHPVTELVTGIDLVEEMIRVAEGEKLRFSQNDVTQKGWAIESRIYAEDVSKNFLPSTGRIVFYHEPITIGSTRIDSGVIAGSEISMFYDPMISKISTYGSTRIEAISNMQKALDEYDIGGVINNIDFLASIFRHPNFISGDINTGFISKFYPDGFHGDILTEECRTVFTLTSAYIYLSYIKASDFDDSLVVFVEDQERMLHVKYNNKTMITIHNHNTITVTGRWVANYRLFEININNDIHILKIEKVKNSYLLKYSGMMAKCSVYPQHIAQLLHFMPKPTESSSKSYVESPISGMVVKVNVIKNDEVQAGQTLCIIEAMKMENAIQAEKKAKIKNVLIKEGDSVQSNDLIIEFYEEVSRKSNER